ncbi:putative GPI-anchor transamidase [Drechmeria coniospora]|uniref:Putative GPI-anchor transamidase n=1 Tax=Drechmeria coniospora TaxID=98403 RepID=A0A151GR18_DRECN|nr:putative GPI-anchor transamidase [Drechmeria coniospora]KYK59508.1 putative GPI-anchor transamidase [Drechmeria coniospora]
MQALGWMSLALAMLAAMAVAEHTSNWAVLVCTSRFWFNYRHLANVLSMYRTVKRLGIPDSQIILMLPDDMACNPRNAFPGTVYSNSDRAVDLYGDNIEVDYRGYEVTVENFIRLLTDRVGAEMPRSKRLLTDDRSNILVYMTGHGGNEFLKFQDAEEIGAYDLADAFEQMWEKKRYHEILFMIDTCQANTMYSRLYSPNIIATGSSELDQSSYSHHADNDVGVAVIDRYTYYNLEFLENQVQDLNSGKTVGDLFDSYDYEKIHSHAGVRYDLFPGGAEAARSRLITDFFGNIQNVEVDRAGGDAALEEQMLALSKTIAALREKAGDGRNASSVLARAPETARKTKETKEQKKMQGATALTTDDWWTKKVVGITALVGCGLLWGLGSLLERTEAEDGPAVLPFLPLTIEAMVKVRGQDQGAAMERSKACPLEALDFRFRPLAPHALAWSCDAELAVALDDAIHVFLPKFPTSGTEDVDPKASQPQFSMSLQASATLRPEPSMNAKLCDVAGIRLPPAVSADDFRFAGVGDGLVTGSGAAIGQVVRVEWSPNSLGQNLRPVLTALVTNGSIVTLGEHIDTSSTMASSATARSFNNWKILWGLGARLPIPDSTDGSQDGLREVDDRIMSFSWARELRPGGLGWALLAYVNDSREVVIVRVRFRSPTLDVGEGDDLAPEPFWDVCEVARFDGAGPHKQDLDSGDPDFVPNRSAFALKWSPWHVLPDSCTASLAYLANNHVGFRKVTIDGTGSQNGDLRVRVERTDTTSICMPLFPDAFVEWEDVAKIWPDDGDGRMARGIIATPFVPRPFQVDLCADIGPPASRHSIAECSALYAPGDESQSQTSTNPITGLVVHRPEAGEKPPAPQYTLVRLSATATNQDWYQTNLPEGATRLPQWAERVRRAVARVVTRASAMEGVYSDESDESDSEGEVADDETGLLSRVHVHRFRLWGLAASPGDGCTAVLVTRHNTQHAYRRPRSTILFGYHDGGDDEGAALATQEQNGNQRPSLRTTEELTTEARLWEALYGGRGDVDDVLLRRREGWSEDGSWVSSARRSSAVQDAFKDLIGQQRCVFCDAPLNVSRVESTCASGHSFATCAATGLPITAPGLSRLCAVCGLRCLKSSELATVARKHLGPEAAKLLSTMHVAGDVCGGCGGKFVS